MKNVAMEVKGDMLVIKVNLAERHGPSGSGKTIIVATTEGNAKIGVGDLTLGLNLFTKEGVEVK